MRTSAPSRNSSWPPCKRRAGSSPTKSSSPLWSPPPGLAQLEAVCEAFFEHLQRRTFPGGCFFAGAALEMGTRPGPVKESVAAFQAGFVDLLRGFAATAIQQHELPAGEDPDRSPSN